MPACRQRQVFTRANHKITLVESLEYCQNNKGLVIFAWCLMSSHMHMVVKATDNNLSEIMRDFKKHTAGEIIKNIKEDPESRRECLSAIASAQAGLLRAFEGAGKNLKRITNFKFWQDGNHPIELDTNETIEQKTHYIHLNPVEDLIVERPEDYLYSSARNYAGMDGI